MRLPGGAAGQPIGSRSDPALRVARVPVFVLARRLTPGAHRLECLLAIPVDLNGRQATSMDDPDMGCSPLGCHAARATLGHDADQHQHSIPTPMKRSGSNRNSAHAAQTMATSLARPLCHEPPARPPDSRRACGSPTARRRSRGTGDRAATDPRSPPVGIGDLAVMGLFALALTAVAMAGMRRRDPAQGSTPRRSPPTRSSHPPPEWRVLATPPA
jgi:hypothetical protein